MRAVRAAGLALALLLAAPGGVACAQSVVEKSAVVTLDQEKLFVGTRYGRALQAQLEKAASDLQDENRKIDAALEAEERDLTDKRAGMDPAAFRVLADAFDKKANELRSAQDAKSRDLTRLRDQARQAFFQNIATILGDYMVERGAVAILDKSAIVVSLGSIDITDGVIAKIDERLGDGVALPPLPSASP